ncbi:MAG: Gfo/Idh/MocA family oxidoreductase [Treponema sp.]|jgi:predicted dehydrogenase|nr:Gfo/Idh/MocA family oxidoreductase [Treponema sp.]
MSQKLSVCLVGLGRIASLLESDSKREKPCTHAGAVSANSDCILRAGMDNNAERRALFLERWNAPVYENAETMFAAERPDIVHIATHPDSHLEYCALAARYGVKVAVCEKPLADTLRKAKKIAALAEGGAITIVVNHERRYSADYREARNILAGEQLGPLLGVKGTLYMGRSRRLLDVLWHDGTHLADAVMFLTGAELYHHTRRANMLSGGTAYLSGILKNPSVPALNPLPFLLELGAERDHLVFELECSCVRGRLRIGNGIFEVWESAESPYAEGFRSLKKTRDGFTAPTGYFSGMVADAAACARDRTRKPQSDAKDALAVIRYLASIKD